MGSRLYVGNLPADVEEREVEDAFNRHGKLRSCYLKGGRDGSSRFAFIEYEETRDADSACRDENGREFGGNRLRVEFARGERDRGGGGDDRGGYGGGGGYSRDRYDDRGGYGGGGRGGYEDRGGYGGGGGRGGYDDRGRGGYGGGGDGFRAGLGPSPYGPSRKTEWAVTVTGLESSMSWQDLKDHFRTFRLEVTHADVDRRGNATAMFASREDMEDALSKVDGSEMKNMRGACILRVDPDTGGGGGGGGYDDRGGSSRGGGGGGYRDDRDRDERRRLTPSPDGYRDRERRD